MVKGTYIYFELLTEHTNKNTYLNHIFSKLNSRILELLINVRVIKIAIL